MLSHASIWKAIEKIAEINGYSASGLARRAGLDPTSFNKSKRQSPDGKPRWPSTESVSLVLQATGTSLAELVALIEDTPQPAPDPLGLPFASTADGGRAALFDAQGRPAGPAWKKAALFPASWQGGVREPFMLEISGRGYEPLWRDGDRLILAPGAPLRRGDRAVLGLTEEDPLVVGEVVRRTATRTALTLPGGGARTLSDTEIAWSARVLWSGR